MDEIFPVLGGVVLGLAFMTRGPTILDRALFAALIIVVAVTASYISGELAESWGYVLIDLLEVAGAAIGIQLLVRLVFRRWKLRSG